MNERKEQLNIIRERPMRRDRVETARLPLLTPERPATHPNVLIERTEVVETPRTRFEVDEVIVLTTTERVKYVLGALVWGGVGIAGFAIDQATHIFDVLMILDVFWMTAALTAYRQLKAATTGKRNTCVSFGCTKDIVQKNVHGFIKKIKDAITGIFGKKTACDGLECPA